MHVCYLCDEYPPAPHGGIGSLTKTLAEHLVQRGHRVTVVGTYPIARPSEQVCNGVRVVRVPHARVRKTGFVINGWRLRAALHAIHRDCAVDVLEGPEAALATIDARFPAARVIRMHGGHHFFAVTLGREPRPWRSWLERRSFQRATDICAVSRFVASRTRDLLGLRDRSIEVLYNPVDVAVFQPRPSVPEDDDRILFVGTVCEKKGIRQLTEAMPDIVRAVPSAQLWVVGRDTVDQRSRQSFTAALQASIPPFLTGRIIFKGPVPHATLSDVLATAAVCVYPSHMEALPIAWLEGLAMGKAVVASETGPGPEVIEDGVSGLLCNPHDPSSIAAQVIRLLQDCRLRRTLGVAARRRALEQFAIEPLLDRNETFYQQARERQRA
jgi:glycosyltransferase involved in cell wall biosynthesis